MDLVIRCVCVCACVCVCERERKREQKIKEKKSIFLCLFDENGSTLFVFLTQMDKLEIGFCYKDPPPPFFFFFIFVSSVEMGF